MKKFNIQNDLDSRRDMAGANTIQHISPQQSDLELIAESNADSKIEKRGESYENPLLAEREKTKAGRKAKGNS